MPRDHNGILSFDAGGVTGRGDGGPLEDSKGGSGGGQPLWRILRVGQGGPWKDIIMSLHAGNNPIML